MTASSPPPAKPFFPGDRATVPAALEQTTESAWAEFEQLHERHEARFKDTQPMSTPTGAAAAYAPTQPMAPRRPGAASPAASAVRRLTVQEVMVLARKNNRVCPVPAEWNRLYELLPGKRQVGRSWEPTPPIAGAAWRATSDMPKRLCLRDHVEWAAEHGALEPVHAFLNALEEEQWHHVGD